MKKEKLLKSILVLTIGIALIAMTTNVFALTDEDLDLTVTEDLSPTIDLNATTDSGTGINTNTNTNTNTSLNTNTNTNTTTNTNNYNTNLPEAGIAENTMLGVALTVLAITAIYAYRKIKYYKNI